VCLQTNAVPVGQNNFQSSVRISTLKGVRADDKSALPLPGDIVPATTSVAQLRLAEVERERARAIFESDGHLPLAWLGLLGATLLATLISYERPDSESE
jgi:hypothetical protein